MDKIEKWMTSPDNPRYEVSSLGRVRNKKCGNIIKQTLTLDGYHRVCLSESGLRNGKSWSVPVLTIGHVWSKSPFWMTKGDGMTESIIILALTTGCQSQNCQRNETH